MSTDRKAQIETQIASCTTSFEVEYDCYMTSETKQGTVDCGGYLGDDGPFFCDDCDGLLIQLEIM